MAGKAKKIVVWVMVLAAAGAAAGYFLWNKPHKDVADAAGIKIKAAALYQAFIEDSAAANTKFIDKIVEVSGTVKSIGVNQQQQAVVTLQAGTGDAAVNCTLEQKDAVLKEGTAIILKGICTGMGEADADLGIMGDVYLIRCYIEE